MPSSEDGRLTPRPSPSRPRKLQRSPAGSDAHPRSRAHDDGVDTWDSYIQVEDAFGPSDELHALTTDRPATGAALSEHLPPGFVERLRDSATMGPDTSDVHSSPTLSFSSSHASSGASPRTPAPSAFSINASSTGGIGFVMPQPKKDPGWTSALSNFGASILPASHAHGSPSPYTFPAHGSRGSIDLRQSPVPRPSSPTVVPLGAARARDSIGGGEGSAWLRNVRGRRRAPADSHAELSSALNFDSAVADWHALLTYTVLDAQDGAPAAAWALSSVDVPPAPQHVLDVGCGIGATWTLAAAQWPPWSETRFVGLDAAPVGVDLSLLPRSIADRLSFYQLSYLDPWPFKDGAFDLIRLGFLVRRAQQSGR